MKSERDCLPLRFRRTPESRMLSRSIRLRKIMALRRTVREFSTDPVPQEVLDECIRIAGLAPSGANRQPWTFVVVSDPALKYAIRIEIERHEEVFYSRAPAAFLQALSPLGTTARKPHLEKAPSLIVIFYRVHEGDRGVNYYPRESIGISTGFLVMSLHLAGLVSLTHTPSSMGLLGNLLRRPSHERAFMILAVGYPAESASVPLIGKKGLEEIRILK